jgi:hypothetical protein
VHIPIMLITHTHTHIHTHIIRKDAHAHNILTHTNMRACVRAQLDEGLVRLHAELRSSSGLTAPAATPAPPTLSNGSFQVTPSEQHPVLANGFVSASAAVPSPALAPEAAASRGSGRQMEVDDEAQPSLIPFARVHEVGHVCVVCVCCVCGRGRGGWSVRACVSVSVCVCVCVCVCV